MTTLKRSMSLGVSIAYALGTILGAGIYVLVGKIASYSLIYVPISLLLASFVALFTALSYAELSSRFPFSGGTAVYVYQAFDKKWLAGFVGWLIVFTGLVSAATLAHGFSGYFQQLIHVPEKLILVLLILSLGLLAAWGMRESAITITVITLIEVAGILFILLLGADSFKTLGSSFTSFMPPFDLKIWYGILSGSFLAFYAYIGFEDLVNVAEEIKNPKRNLPIAIIVALFIATVLYLLVAIVLVHTLPIQQLINSKAPFTLLVESKGYSGTIITLISLVAVINGILVQIIMGSRLIYGMAEQGTAPSYFSSIQKTTRTPLRSTGFVTVIILMCTLWLKMDTLAKLTNFIILCAFSLVNLSLIVIKMKNNTARDHVSYPIYVPIIGFSLTMLFLIIQISELFSLHF